MFVFLSLSCLVSWSKAKIDKPLLWVYFTTTLSAL